jgi:hypothetical protein
MRKIQYIVVESQYVTGVNNAFTIDFGSQSNVFIQEMRDVIGLKMVDFYVTSIGENENDATVGIVTSRYIDVLCPDIPTSAQILSERNPQLFARIPLERVYKGASNVAVTDKQWVPFERTTNYFNPITIKKLRFAVNVLRGDGSYVPLQRGVEFYMILEVTTMDHTQPPEDTNLLVVEAVKKLGKRIDRLNTSVALIPLVDPERKVPVRYLGYAIGAIVVISIILFLFQRRTPTSGFPDAPHVSGPPVAPQPLVPSPAAVQASTLGLGAPPLRVPGFGPRGLL